VRRGIAKPLSLKDFPHLGSRWALASLRDGDFNCPLWGATLSCDGPARILRAQDAARVGFCAGTFSPSACGSSPYPAIGRRVFKRSQGKITGQKSGRDKNGAALTRISPHRLHGARVWPSLLRCGFVPCLKNRDDAKLALPHRWALPVWMVFEIVFTNMPPLRVVPAYQALAYRRSGLARKETRGQTAQSCASCCSFISDGLHRLCLVPRRF